MSFTTHGQPSVFTSLYGVRQSDPYKIPPVQYNAIYHNAPNGPHIDEINLKTARGMFSLSYENKSGAPHRFSLSDHEGKVLGQVTFDTNGEVEAKAPGLDGKLVRAEPAVARHILSLTKNALSHPAVAHAGEKTAKGMTEAIKTATNTIERAMARIDAATDRTAKAETHETHSYAEPTYRGALRVTTAAYAIASAAKPDPSPTANAAAAPTTRPGGAPAMGMG